MSLRHAMGPKYYAEIDWHAHGLPTPDEQRKSNRLLGEAIDRMGDVMVRDTAPPAEKDPFAGLVVGRHVYYWPEPNQEKQAAPGPWSAVVTLVGDVAGVVTLNVQLPKPTLIGDDPVQRIEKVHYSEVAAPGCWGWPPRA